MSLLSIECGMLSGDRLRAESSNESSDEDKNSQCVALGEDAVWLLSPLHHQNVPQKLPAVIKPGIKLEQSLQTSELCQIVSDKNHAESKIFPNQIVPGGCGRVRQRSTSAELSARPRYKRNCFSVFSSNFQLSSPLICGQWVTMSPEKERRCRAAQWRKWKEWSQSAQNVPIILLSL